MKRWAKRLLLVVISIFVALLLAEGFVRVVGAGDTFITRGRFHCFDSEAGWKCLPDLDARYCLPGSFNVRVLCNSRGLRDGEKDPRKPPGTRRIVVLGDSFMWGYGVENHEIFSSLLEKELPRTESINLGVNGYSTVQELVRLETEGVRYEPDWTVLVFCWNDLEDNFDDKDGGRPAAVLEGQETLRIINRPVRKPWKSPFKQWFRHHSRLFAYCEYCTEAFRMKRKENRGGNAPEEEGEGGSGNPRRGDPGKDSMTFSRLDLYSPPRPGVDRAWTAMGLLLARMKDLASRDGGRLLVVYGAALEAASRKAFANYARTVGEDPDATAMDWNRPSRRLGALCTGLGIPFLDLNPAFRSHGENPSLFLKNNNHWSAEGHRLAAAEVSAGILSLEGK